jgi:dinuclear metal center YbgI/SA1388 family protein
METRLPENMTVGDIAAVIEAWAPKTIAWDGDNIGLQVGSIDEQLKGILVSLDINEQVVTEARRRRCNLLVSHHPLLFRPLRSVDTANEQARCLREILRNRMSVYAAHTNLDFTRGGTSFALAATIGLQDVDFLRKPYATARKVVTYVPPEHVDGVSAAMAKAGAGRIGNYEQCSFHTKGIGTFRGTAASTPFVGERMKMQRVEEVRLEMIVDQWNVERVVAALKRAHPYEEIAFEVYPTENKSDEYGQGVLGVLRRPLRLKSFLSLVKKQLGAGALRYAGELDRTVSRVAACGGSGSELLHDAIRQEADVFVTADVKYHAFQEATPRIALVDAGHYETEYPIIREIVKRLKAEILRKKASLSVLTARTSTNPLCVL